VGAIGNNLEASVADKALVLPEEGSGQQEVAKPLTGDCAHANPVPNLALKKKEIVVKKDPPAAAAACVCCCCGGGGVAHSLVAAHYCQYGSTAELY
jgi:hypothetical protein